MSIQLQLPTIRRLLKIIGLFCRTRSLRVLLQKRHQFYIQRELQLCSFGLCVLQWVMRERECMREGVCVFMCVCMCVCMCARDALGREHTAATSCN